MIPLCCIVPYSTVRVGHCNGCVHFFSNDKSLYMYKIYTQQIKIKTDCKMNTINNNNWYENNSKSHL